MKKTILFALLVFGINTRAQITHEHTYDNAATWNYCMGNIGQLMMIKFEVSGERYVKVNRCQKLISIYDLNHSLVKNISLAALPVTSNYQTLGDFLYFSEKLFNTDSKMEYMYIVESGTLNPTTIYNEDGTVLFSDPGIAWIKPNYHQQQYPVYNTSQGTKMILSYNNGNASVFGLGGTLSTAIQTANNELIKDNDAARTAYPNPTSDNTRIDYVLPEGVATGEIVVYDVQAKEIKRYTVDRSFDHLLLSTSDIPAGTYFYKLLAGDQLSSAKKIVVIK